MAKKKLSKFEDIVVKNINKKIKVIFKNGYEQEGNLVDWEASHIVICQKIEENVFQNVTIHKDYIKEIIPIHIEESGKRNLVTDANFLTAFKK
jgi:hypothetical protein